jgi:hypothetical protein
MLPQKRKAWYNMCNLCRIWFCTSALHVILHYHKSSFDRHVKSKRDNIRKHMCTHCDFTWSKKGNLVRHVKSKHNTIRDHKCTMCDFAALRITYVVRHGKFVYNTKMYHLNWTYICIMSIEVCITHVIIFFDRLQYYYTNHHDHIIVPDGWDSTR